MLIPNHPDDERLSALASNDTDAVADVSVTDHVATCARCGELVHELGALRASLAELPDLVPSRPLALLPPVEADASRVDRLGGWARRFFAPVLTAGAALAIVGLVGTAVPALNGAQSAGSVFQAATGGAAEEPAVDDGAGAPAAASADDGAEALRASAEPASSEPASERNGAEGGDSSMPAEELAERSPWPMVLFTGVALMIGAALLRWILVPRAG